MTVFARSHTCLLAITKDSKRNSSPRSISMGEMGVGVSEMGVGVSEMVLGMIVGVSDWYDRAILRTLNTTTNGYYT